jgi:hypothetical protein
MSERMTTTDRPTPAEVADIMERARQRTLRRAERAEAKLAEAVEVLRAVFDGYVDACWQGSGNEPLSSVMWHNFLSTYEEADELIPRARAFLASLDESNRETP